MTFRVKEFLLPALLLTEILFALTLGDIVPNDIKSLFLSISLTLKSILLSVLPFIIFSYVMGSMSELKQGAFSFVILAFAMVVTSNFVLTSFAGLIGYLTLPHIALAQTVLPSHELVPLWDFSLPKLVSNEFALFSGIIIGIATSMLGTPAMMKIARTLPTYANRFLKTFFIPVLPIFVLGFIFKIEHEGILENIFQNYLSIIFMIIGIVVSYLVLLYGVANQFKLQPWMKSLQNMIPAMITGFSTMSSASALPLLITAAEKNTNESLVRGVVPISVNIHLLGDCFSLSVLALAIMISFGHPLPTPSEYLLYVSFFVLAKFAVAGVPGGTVLVMLPVFEKYLGFNSDMLSLITLLYILFDPLITPMNLLGNGAFAMLFMRLYRMLGLRAPSATYAPTSGAN